MTFAERLRDLRKRLGLTQEQLASRLRVAPSTIKRWEGGEILAPRYASEINEALANLERERVA